MATIQVEITITDADSGLAVADVSVWITSDAAGASVVDGTYPTDSNGKYTFLLDDGATYYLWGQKDGMQQIAGTSFVAAAAGNAFTMSEALAASATPVSGGVTKLSAVNKMLKAAGLRPVVALGTGGDSDVALAEATLDDVDLELQSNGYFFNIEEDVEIAKDSNNQIPLAANIIDVEPVSPNNATRRGAFLYDLDDQTFTFTSNATVNRIIRVDFEDTPATFREWVTAEAAMRFQSETIGSAKIDKFTKDRLKRVQAKFLSHDARTGNYSQYRNQDTLRMRGFRNERV